MSLEHAPENRRAYYTSFTLSGTQAGQILATAAFLPVAALPEEQLMSWGWRVPFWFSAVVVVVAVVIRSRLEETPVFKQDVTGDERRQTPLVDLFRDHWSDVLRVVAASLIASVSTIFTVYALSYAVNTIGLERTPILWVGVLANIVALLAIPLFAALSDRIGRKPVFISGSLGCAVLMFGYLWSLSTGNYPLIFLTGILLFGVVYSAPNGIWPSFYGEMFSTKVRLSGMAIGTQIGFTLAGFAPSIATAIGSSEAGWIAVSLFTAALCLLNVIAVATGKETYRVPTRQLGRKTAPDAGPTAAAA